MLAINRESVWRDHRPDVLLTVAVTVMAMYFVSFVRPWSPGYCSVFTLQIFFWGTLLSAWSVAVLRFVVGIAFHRLATITAILLLVAMFVVDMALLASARVG